ncbi:MAG: dTDP-4-dehydrorhamnose reductase [Bacteroidales bacterium]|nr:dTDP-4-dehydrorhamnose reductase [Bacteroidales bacterium]
MNILVTGAHGQLGSCLSEWQQQHEQASYRFFFTDVEELDITDRQAIERYVSEKNINIIINAAAYTNVDKAETEPEKALLLNATAVHYLAEIAQAKGLFLVHISTDYVFDGQASTPYPIDAPVCPLSVYGKTKAAGEKAVMDSGAHTVIIRTSWLYSVYGNNFVKTMLRLGSERPEIRVVSDQIGSPTSAHDLAEAIMQLIENKNIKEKQILLHYSNAGTISWYDFACAIMQFGKRNTHVIPITTAEYPTLAPRPSWSVMDLSLTQELYPIEIKDWKESLARVVQTLL